MQALRVIGGGAVENLIRRLQPGFTVATGRAVDGTFGAVGTMLERLRNRTPVDVVILTSTMVRQLADDGLLDPRSVIDVGQVQTAIAIRQSDPIPHVGDAAALRATLLAADGIYFPDPTQATAGNHFSSVLRRLGIATVVEARERRFPNGMSAMRALANAPEQHPIGCTQLTEIVANPGVSLVAGLPPGYQLTTTYSAATTIGSPAVEDARQFLSLLAAGAHSTLHAECGFNRVQPAHGHSLSMCFRTVLQ